MKVKGNTGLALKTIGLISAVTGAVLLILRLYQALALTDGTTGFFTENNFTVALFYILFGAAVIIPLVLCYICSDMPSGELKKKPSFLYIFSVIFFSASLLIEGVQKVRVFFGTSAQDFVTRKEAVGGNIGFCVMIFSLLSVISLLLSLAIYVKDGSVTGKLKIPMLFPVIWAFLRTLGFFSVTVSYLKVAGLLVTIFAFAFTMIFLFENARMLTGVGRKTAVWFFFASGFISAALCFSAGIPALAVHFFSPENEVTYCPYDLSVITAGLYALTSVLSRIGVKEETSEEASEEASASQIAQEISE